MSPRFHPAHAVLIDHAAGSLAAGRRLVVTTHVAACAVCRDEVALAESVGGALLAGLPPAEMRTDALARALASVERPPRAPRPTPSPRSDWIVVPPIVLEAAQRRRRWAAPGVWVAPVAGHRKGLSTYLLRVGAGMSMPLHTHRGSEMVCVLKGAFTDRDDVHHPGDFAENGEETTHRPTATRDGECVCLIAVHGALVPRDWIGRLVQPFVGI